MRTEDLGSAEACGVVVPAAAGRYRPSGPSRAKQSHGECESRKDISVYAFDLKTRGLELERGEKLEGTSREVRNRPLFPCA